MPQTLPYFTPATFSWLTAIHHTPAAAFYLANKAAFREHVEQPIQSLLRDVAARLPALARDRLETQRNVFSRFIKNDFGRGGAWSNYWGAFYPRGSRRLADVQLAAWLNRERLHASFYIGDYAGPVRDRFRRNLSHLRPHLPKCLHALVSNPGYRLAREGRTVLNEEARVVPAQPMTWDAWLDDPAAGDYWVFLPFTPHEAITLPGEALASQIARAHADFFALALLAMEDDPLPVLEAYLAG